MNKVLMRQASVALAAAVAVIFVARAYPLYPIIVSSFPLRGATPRDPRGIHDTGNNIHVISRDGPGKNYLYRFTWDGSFISSVVLPGAQVLADADRLPEPYPRHYFAVVDIVPNDVKIYTTEGSFVSTFLQPPANTVAIGVGGHVVDYVYLATREGVIFRYTPEGSFIGSFATGIETSDLTASACYGGAWGDYIQIAPRSLDGPIYSFYRRNGVLVGTFYVPGIRNCGASGYGSTYRCLREDADGLWAYKVNLGRGMPVEPASLGRIKALYK